MPRLRRLSGLEIVAIFQQYGFSLARIRGSHHIMRRTIGDKTQTLTVPVHGRAGLALPTLRSIYRQACEFIDEDELKKYFYTD